jgi:hypothetical protein
MLDLYTNYPVLDFLENNFVKDLKKIKSYEESKPKSLDLLAKLYYNNVNSWWIIALYNDIIDPFEVPNKIIKIPNYFEVQNLYADYKIKEKMK